MRIYLFTWALALAALPAAADEAKLRIELLHGHTIYREQVREAGVATGLTLSVNEEQAAVLTEPCEHLRAAASLANELSDGSHLRVLFIVPRKGMAVEGYYFPADRDLKRAALKPGGVVARPTLDRIIAGAGIPSVLLDEDGVELEISCHVNDPLWVIAWLDVRRIGDRRPEAVVDAARLRFMTIHRQVAGYAQSQVLAQRERSPSDH
jgi:hypothetical protein